MISLAQSNFQPKLLFNQQENGEYISIHYDKQHWLQYVPAMLGQNDPFGQQLFTITTTIHGTRVCNFDPYENGKTQKHYTNWKIDEYDHREYVWMAEVEFTIFVYQRHPWHQTCWDQPDSMAVRQTIAIGCLWLDAKMWLRLDQN